MDYFFGRRALTAMSPYGMTFFAVGAPSVFKVMTELSVTIHEISFSLSKLLCTPESHFCYPRPDLLIKFINVPIDLFKIRTRYQRGSLTVFWIAS